MNKVLLICFLFLNAFQLNAADYYWVGGSGNWSDLNHWASVSGGTPNKSIIPLSGDDVYFDANSGLDASSVIILPTLANAACHNMSWVGVTAAATFRANSSNSVLELQIYGNLELSPIVKYGMANMVFMGSGNATYKTNGALRLSTNWYNQLTVNKLGGSLKLLDGIPEALGVGALTLQEGTLDLSGNTHEINRLLGGFTTARTLNLTNATLKAGTEFYFNATNGTLLSTGSSIITNAFSSNGLSFSKVEVTGVSGSPSIGNTTISELLFSDPNATAGSVRLTAGNTVDRLEFKGGGRIESGNNVINKLILAPSKGYVFRENITINELFQFNTPDCEALGQITGGPAISLNFAPAAVVDIGNAFLTNLVATGNVTPITLTGADGGGNIGFNIQPRATGSTLYWVGGTGNWDDKSHWSATSGGVGGSCVPFTGDDVIFDSNSGFTAASKTVTVAGNAWCHNMTWINVANSPALNTGNAVLEVYGNIELDPSLTISGILFSKGSDESTFTTKGCSQGTLSLRVEKAMGVGGLTLSDDVNFPLLSIQHTSGKLIMANHSITMSVFNSSGNGRIVDISNSIITVTDNWLMAAPGATWVNNAVGSFVTSNRAFTTNGLTYPKVYLSTDLNVVNITGTTIAELVFTNTSPTSLVFALNGAGNNTIGTLDVKSGGVTFRGNNTINNLLLTPSRTYYFRNTQTINGLFRFNNPDCEGLGELRGFDGTTPTISFGPGATQDFNNVYVQNMTATGSGVPISVAGADAGGNTGFNITASAGGARYWVGGSGDWNESAHWSTTSGGTGGACVPTVSNDVFFNVNSFTAGSSAVTISQGNAYCRNMDWTGATNSPTFSKPTALTLEIWGSLVMNPLVNPSIRVAFMGPANATFSPNNSTLGTFSMDILKPGSSLTFLGDYNNPNAAIVLTSGGLDLNGRNITASVITDESTAQPTSLDIRNANYTGKWQYTGSNKTLQASGSKLTASVFKVNGGIYDKVDVTANASSNISITQTTIADLLFSNTANTSQAFVAANNTIDRLEFKGKGYISGTGNTIETLIFSPGKMYTFLSGSTTTITKDWFGSGTPCNLTEINSSAAGAFTITKTTGEVELDYVRLRNITAAGVTPFKALEHTENLGGNTNWNITPYNNSTPILGLGSDRTLSASDFPYTIKTNGFFASPMATYSWGDGSTSSTLIVADPGTYNVTVSYPDGCSRQDEIIITRAAADLAVVKAADNMTPAVGSDVVFTLAATNNGPQQSVGISVTDLLSAGYTYKSAVAPVGTTYDAGTGVWTIGTLSNGATTNLTITATVNTAGPYANTATITGPEVDSDPANNTSEITPVPVPTADVSVVKTVDNGSPQVGSNVVFTLDVSNAGPSEATGIELTDVLPSGYNFVSAATPAGSTYDPSTGLWAIGTLANGATATATITATVNASGIYANTATITLTENDPQAANNSSTVTPVPISQANLSIAKIVNNLQPYAGNNVTFTLTAANAGPSNATGVQVNDLLPSGYTFVSATPSVGIYNSSTGIWTIGTLANGANATLGITATVKDAGVFANSATITGTETDPATANNSSTVTPTPIIIKITKTGPITVNAGSVVQYTLSVKNTGTGNALAAAISDMVPVELTNVSWTTAVQGTAAITNGATGTGNNISVTGDIPAGAANQIDILVSGTIPSSSLATSISNTATVSATDSPVFSSNTVITAIGREVDLHVQKTGPATIVAGSSATYTLNVTNTGPSDANNVTITDNIPVGLNNVSWTASVQNGATINGASTGMGNVNLSAFIPAGTASISVTITGTLDTSYADATLVNTATADPEAGVTDPTPASSTVTSTVSRRANVRIVKSGPANIGAGENISYTIRVTNDGPSDAPDVEIQDMIPVQVLNPTWTTSVQNGATLNALNGTGNINLTGSIPAGTGLIEIVVSGQVDPGLADASTFSNTATADLPVGSPVTDPEPSSNTSTIQTIVNNTPDIRVSKNGPATVNIGDPITYTIVITNGGGGNVTNASIEDNVPASVTVTNWNIIAVGGAVVTGAASGTTNTINTTGDIPASAAASLTLTVQGTVNATATPIFTNTVTVTADGVATSSVATAVNQSTDIVVEKNGPQAVIAGRPISYTIKLGNAGPQNAQGLILDDVIPAAVENVTWSAATVGAAVLNSPSSGNTNTVMLNTDVNAGAGNYVLVTVNGTVSPSILPSTITNTASVTLPGALTDFDLTNNTSVVATVVSRETNLAITKAVDNVAPDTGTNVMFTLVATNNGPSEATGVNVADLLPAGYTYVSSTPGAGTSYNAGTGAWAINTLANAASSSLTIIATINAAGSYANTATISGTEPDPIMANNTATVTPVPVPVTDLMITKAVDNLTPDVGSNIVFMIVASNNGPSAGTGVSVTDLLPAGYTYLNSTPSPGTTYDLVTGLWTIGTLTNAASSTLTITATVRASGPYENTATISGTENDPVIGNNTATVSPVPVPVTDLAITKTADNLTPNAGSNVVFTVVATNNGPSGATGVNVTDLLPSGYTYVGSTVPGTSYAPITGVWAIGTLANAASSTLTITARVNASGPYTNIATISGTEVDPSAANNSATFTPVPVPVTDLAITKTADNLTPNAGSNVVFTVVATNNGPSGATGVNVTDLLPSGYTYVSSAAPAGTTYTPVTGVWTIGTLANGGSSTLTITARVNGSGPYDNTATISGTESDPSAANNTSTVTPVPIPVADLSIAKTVDNVNPEIGSNVVFTIVATNTGPSNGTGISVTDVLPSGYTYINSTAPAGTTYDPATGLWTVGTLADGASATLTITARVNTSGLYANSAIISGTETDLVTANNASSVTPVPVPVTDLMVVKTADQSSAPVGSNIVFTIVASNNGPSEGTEVTVTDLLPDGYTYVSLDPEVGTSYDAVTGIWTIGTLANGASATLTVTATLNASGDYMNTAIISGSENDPIVENNTAIFTPTAQNSAITLVKTASVGGTGSLGDDIIYTFTVTNTGEVALTGVVIEDALTGSADLTVSPSTLAPGEVGTATASYTITQLDIDAGHVSNTATVTGIAPSSSIVTDTSGTAMDNDDPTVTVLDQQSSIAIIKYALFNDENNDGYAQIEETISYSFSVVNTGNVMLTDIMVHDPLPGIVMQGGPITLTAGASDTTTFTGQYVITSSDFTAGRVSNQATVSGIDTKGLLVTDLSDHQDEFGNSPTIVEIEGCTLTVHNALSPNNDGMNDFLNIKGIECYPDNLIQIYNRWGALVFEMKGYNNSSNVFQGYSDGRSTINRNEALPAGTYFYVLHINKTDGTTTNKKGYLNINR
tara:strand:- start:5660 stop:15532 length:9873 start_codon:yes stop_codon:yes gene_type:complete